MKQATLLILACITLVSAHAQQGVMVRQSAGISTFFYTSTFSGSDLQAAIYSCNPLGGDTLILPGATFTVTSGNIQVDRPIVFIGAGYQASSSPAAPTVIVSPPPSDSFIFNDGSDGSAVHGVSFYASGTSSMGVTIPEALTQNLHFHRCLFSSVQLGVSSSGTNNSQIHFEECLFSSLTGSGATNVSVDNCIFKSGEPTGLGANFTMSNSIVHAWGNISTNTGATFTSNVYMRSASGNISINADATFDNCLFVQTCGATITGPGTVINCQCSALVGLFQSVSSPTTYSSANDYEPVPGSLADNMNVGIYEGSHPWKDGAVPFNPHWTGLTVPGTTNGGLIQNVVIQGQAQPY